MPNADALSKIARRYQRFATTEARGSSPIYEQLALAVAGSAELLAFLASLPFERQQPNLFLAAVRHVAGVPSNGRAMEEIVRTNAAGIRDLMLTRTTQTNEPARCAVLVPVLAALPQPLALIEVGASAGLCLLLDRYAYDYGRHHVEPALPSSIPFPVFSCVTNDATPIPRALPEIAWRCGLDLNPLNVNSPSEIAWLETLIWPGQERRVSHLRAAIEIARARTPLVLQGNLLTDLPSVTALAPNGMQLVVCHCAVLGYVASQSDRAAFASTVRQAGALWISNEPPHVFPDIARAAPPPPSPGQFLLAVNGKPVAWTAPHGQSIEWFAS